MRNFSTSRISPVSLKAAGIFWIIKLYGPSVAVPTCVYVKYKQRIGFMTGTFFLTHRAARYRARALALRRTLRLTALSRESRVRFTLNVNLFTYWIILFAFFGALCFVNNKRQLYARLEKERRIEKEKERRGAYTSARREKTFSWYNECARNNFVNDV